MFSQFGENRLTHSMNQFIIINDKGVCTTTPATLSHLTMAVKWSRGKGQGKDLAKWWSSP